MLFNKWNKNVFGLKEESKLKQNTTILVDYKEASSWQAAWKVYNAYLLDNSLFGG